jgi:hypothetical protein
VGPAIVVIGASEGGVDALCRIAARLDARAPAIWCIVLHTMATPATFRRFLNVPGRFRIVTRRRASGPRPVGSTSRRRTTTFLLPAGLPASRAGRA